MNEWTNKYLSREVKFGNIILTWEVQIFQRQEAAKLLWYQVCKLPLALREPGEYL